MEDWLPLLWAVICVVVVLGMAWWATRCMAGRGLPGGLMGVGRAGRGQIRVLEQQALGRDQRLVAVQVGEQCFLLGVTQGQITLLSEIAWPAQEPEGTAQAPAQGAPFREALSNARKKARR